MNQRFAVSFRQQRERKRMPQAELAARAGISVRTLRYWEAGETLPRTTELEKVLDILEMTAEEKIQLHALIPEPRSHRHLKRQENTLRSTDPVLLPHAGDLLRAMRLRTGKTQEQLAAELGVTSTTLTRWEALRNFPSEDNVARICVLLEASPEETFALMARHVTHSEFADTADIETCKEQLEQIIHRIRAHAPVTDLLILALQRRLYLMTQSEPEALYLLARAQLALAHIHYLKSHKSAVKLAAKKAMALFTDSRRLGEHWALALNLLATDVGKGEGDYLAKVKFLHRNLWPAAGPEMKLRMYCDMALYLSKAQKYDEALRMISQAQNELHLAPETAGNHHYFALSYGRVLVNQGDPNEAMKQLESITRHDPYNPLYLCYRAEAALAMGERGVGAYLIQQAWDMVARSPFTLVHNQVHRIAQRL